MPNSQIRNDVPNSAIRNTVPNSRVSAFQTIGVVDHIKVGMPIRLLLSLTYASNIQQVFGEFRPNSRIVNTSI